MKPEISKIFGEELQFKVFDLLDSNLNTLNEMMEKKFNEMKENHQRDKEEIIQTIQNEISTLRTDISAKEAQINELKLKEVELRGKDEVIATLNRNIDIINQ
jgi:uncharacterized protein HemX